MQKKAADNMISQEMTKGRVNKGKALKEAGYAEYVQKNPKLVTESKGFLKYMEEAGITKASIAEMLADDLREKPRERLGELKLASELMMIKENNLNVNFNQSDKGLESLASIVTSMRDEEGEDEETSEDS